MAALALTPSKLLRRVDSNVLVLGVEMRDEGVGCGAEEGGHHNLSHSGPVCDVAFRCVGNSNDGVDIF